MFLRKTIVLSVLFCSISILTSGCGEKKPDGVKLYGTVTLDGVPLETGNIAFYQKELDQSFGSVIKNGKYETAAKPGAMTVRITSRRQTGTKPRNDFPGDTAEDPVFESLVPEKYNTKTTLKCDVGPSGGVQDFELSSKP